MNIYVYNSTISTNTYSAGDYGSISSPVTESIDYSAGLSLPTQTTPNYSTQNYILPKPDFSSTNQTFDSSFTFDINSTDFSSLNETFDLAETFDSALYENFGNIYDSSTITPFGSLSTSGGLTGEAITFHYTAPQATLPISGNALSALVKFWVGSGTLFEIGSGLERTVKPYIASGTLRIDSGAAGTTALESITKAYNLSSIYNLQLDYGSITSSVTDVDDLGFLTQQDPQYFPYDDFGSLTETPISSYSLLPFVPGISISGSASEAYTYQRTEDTILFNISGSSLESYTYQRTEDTVLYTFYGELVHPNIDYTPHYGIDENIGVGTTGIKFGAGVRPERFTFAYSIDSPCYDSIAESDDYGFLSGQPINPIDSIDPDFYDYGLVSEEETGNIPDDSGWILAPLVTVCPGGSINIVNGFSPKEQYPWLPEPGIGRSWSFGANYVSSGNISISGAALKALSAQTPENTVLYTFSGTAPESFSAQTPEDTQLFSISGSGLESFSAQTPEDTQLFSISGIAIESFSAQTPENFAQFTFSGGYNDLQFIANPPENTQLFTISGFIVEKNTESYVGVGTLILSGSGLESFSAQTPEDTQLFSISGELVHPNIDYTPHYGIEKNIGVGTTGIKFGVGVGTFPDADGNPRDAKTYSNRYGFQIGDFNLGSGIGTIRLPGVARTRSVLPYKAQGSISLSGIGNEAFCRTNYDGSGISTLSGIASTREIAVYGYYGDDNNPGTSGTVFISQQTSLTIEKDIDAYEGSGQLNVSGNSVIRLTNSFVGLSTIQLSGTASESFSAQTPEDTQLFSISGIGLEVYSAQTPETEVLYIINGFIEESITNSYIASGSATLSGSSSTFYVPNYPARGFFRFVHHNVDNDYDTCDNELITCDDQDSAYVSFTANPVENTVLFDFDGDAVTAEIATYTGVGSGLYTFSGTYQNIKLTHSESGIGTIFITQTSPESEGDVYVGSGNLFTLSGDSESYSAQTPESTILFQISGSATTSVESDYPVVGIGLFALSGNAITSEIATYTQIGSGTINLSGELIYPDIIFVPSPDGSGTINILGSSNESLTKIYDNTSGTLFGFSSGLESFTKSTYIGLGTIYIQKISASTIDNPFQIPRTYIVII